MTRFLLALSLIAATAQARSIVIDDFAAEITVSADGFVSVTETLQVSFAGSWNGIYRHIPYRYTYPSGLRATLHLDVESVTDGQGAPLWHQTSREDGDLRLKIAVPGAQDATRTVVIRYRSRNTIRSYDEDAGYAQHDELYWNVTGNGWPFPILRASATVRLPEGVPARDMRSAAFTGPYRSRASDQQTEALPDGRIRFMTTAPLREHEGLTIVVGFPVGFVKHPTWMQEAWWLFAANWGVLFPVAAALAWLVLWWRRGRDSLKGATIIPEFEPPHGLRPSETGVVADDRLDARDVSACIVDLAARGYMDIDVRGKEPVFRLKKTAWRKDGRLNGYEVKILDALFKDGRVIGFARQSRLGKAMEEIRDAIYERLVTQRFFRGRPDEVRQRWRMWTWAVFVAAAIAGMIWATWWVTALLLVPCAIVMFRCAARMPQRTGKGLDALRRIRGMEDYLETAEKERLKDMPRSHFEQLLPYAIALGVHDRWTELFEEMFQEPPPWFVGAEGTTLPANFYRFMRSTRVATFYTPPRSHMTDGGFGGGGGGWSGGSGFRGGGFSGGGFGGGGGGGW